MIAGQTAAGTITTNQATQLRHVLARLQDATGAGPDRWHPGRFRKQFSATPSAAPLARAALIATAVGIPAVALDDAALLTTELVTNSVVHSGSAWVEVDIALTADRLRIEVSDQDHQAVRPRTPALDGGWGLTIIGELSTRWGVERHDRGKTVWVELQLQKSPATN